MNFEIEEAVQSLKKEKAASFDNIPAELLKNGGGCTIEIYHKIRNLLWRSGEWQNNGQCLIILLAKKGDPKKCSVVVKIKFRYNVRL